MPRENHSEYLEHSPLDPHGAVTNRLLESLEEQVESDELFLLTIVISRSNQSTEQDNPPASAVLQLGNLEISPSNIKKMIPN